MAKPIEPKEIIQFTGLKDLNDDEKEILNTLSTEYYQKFKRELKNLTSMGVHVKIYTKGGKTKKYSLHVKVIAPTKIFESEKAADWDFARTLHKAFKDLEKQIVKGLRSDTSYRKEYN